MTRTPAARGHRHLFVGRPRQLRVAMNRGSAARTALFCHVWVMQASISKCSQLRGCSDWLRLWVVSRTRLRSRLHVWPLHWPAAPVPDQHSACHGYCRADLDVARAGTLPAHLFHRLGLMRARVVVLKICATIYSDHRDLGRLQISARVAVAAWLYCCQQIGGHGLHDLDDRHQHQCSVAAPLPRGITTFFAPNDE